MINSSVPKNWKDLQLDVFQILSESGLNAEIEKTIITARGKATIDVFAIDSAQTPPGIYLCECKYWKKNVPKYVVHAFRTILNDFGGNWGLIISKEGFQKGAYETSKNTNIELLNWQQFQDLFAERWYRGYMVKKLTEEAGPLIKYTDPINSRIFGKADTLPPKRLKRFLSLRKKYSSLAVLTSMLADFDLFFNKRVPTLPLLNIMRQRGIKKPGKIPIEILQATSLHELLNLLIEQLHTAIKEFDEVFGGRA